MKSLFAGSLILVAMVIVGIFLFKDRLVHFLLVSPKQETVALEGVDTKNPKDNVANPVTVVAQDLSIPWELAFLPNGDILVTERAGKLVRVSSSSKTVTEVDGVAHIGEGGLLGLALDPNFSSNKLIYLYSTTQNPGGIQNRVEKYIYENDKLTQRETILGGIKGSKNHDGGKIAFGPDGKLYISTGDAEEPNSSQDKESLNGKILRINSDGSIPEDNPFGNAVYAYGLRNVQGLTWDGSDRLWATEHGPSGSETGNDELNLIEMGGNYGWPLVRGMEEKEGMITPAIESGKTDTWAPGSVVYLDSNLYFTGLRGEALYKVSIVDVDRLSLTANFKKEFGRLRGAVLGPDGFIYVTTSNKDGRGSPKANDDKILKIDPSALK